MSTNFYWLGGDDWGRDHIGKRSAAGSYCWDCRVTLCKEGESQIHFNGTWLGACPRCGATHARRDGFVKGPAAVELGFAEPEETPPSGVEGAASFSWAIHPDAVRLRCEANMDVQIIRDEYDRLMTGREFLRMLAANCPINFLHIGEAFS